MLVCHDVQHVCCIRHIDEAVSVHVAHRVVGLVRHKVEDIRIVGHIDAAVGIGIASEHVEIRAFALIDDESAEEAGRSVRADGLEPDGRLALASARASR